MTISEVLESGPSWITRAEWGPGKAVRRSGVIKPNKWGKPRPCMVFYAMNPAEPKGYKKVAWTPHPENLRANDWSAIDDPRPRFTAMKAEIDRAKEVQA